MLATLTRGETSDRKSLASHLAPRIALFGAWLAVVLWLASHHVVWRDEVRALSFAIAGDSWADMLRGLHGEGHPALWYILLRAAHDLAGVSQVLPAVSLAVAALMAALLVFLSPFPLPLIALILAGHAFVYEYSVMARNYGLGALLIFAAAAVMRNPAGRGLGLGVLLALMANSNAIATVVAVSFLAFWLLEIVEQEASTRGCSLRTFALGAAVTTLGVALAFATIYPTFNDAAFSSAPKPSTSFLLDLSFPFAKLIGFDVTPSHIVVFGPRTLAIVGPALLVGSVLGLLARPPALLAALLSLLTLALFFDLGIKGDYRHEMTWLAFLIALYWISWTRLTQETRTSRRLITRVGLAAFVALLAVQAIVAVADIDAIGIKREPESRSQDLARLLESREDLKDAILIADPDYVLEPLRYWINNRFYFVRERRFGDTAIQPQVAFPSVPIRGAGGRSLAARGRRPACGHRAGDAAQFRDRRNASP